MRKVRVFCGAAVWLVCILVLTSVGVAQEEQKESEKHPGEKLYRTKTCFACHGKNGGKAILYYPNLAGQDAKYLYEQARAITTKERVGSGEQRGGPPRTLGMAAIMHVVSEEELKQITDWLSLQEPTHPNENLEPLDPEAYAQAERLYLISGCAGCHGEFGNTPLMPGYPRIAGQKVDYLVYQMLDIKNKDRTNGNTAVMQPMAARLSDEEITLISEYLARFRPKRIVHDEKN